MTTTVTGCLGAGDAADPYVLTAARANGATDTATYQLEGTKGDQLRGHIGERVQVSGTAIPRGGRRQQLGAGAGAAREGHHRPADRADEHRSPDPPTAR